MAQGAGRSRGIGPRDAGEADRLCWAAAKGHCGAISYDPGHCLFVDAIDALVCHFSPTPNFMSAVYAYFVVRFNHWMASLRILCN